MLARLAASLLAIAGLSRAQQPDPAEQLAFIHDLRANALRYTENLPNFICTQVTKRFIDYTGAGDTWKSLDTIEEQLTYFERRERYRIQRVNGRTPIGRRTGQGITSSGEFSSTLREIFDPASAAAFTWERTELLRARPMYARSSPYRASRRRSAITARCMRTGKGRLGCGSLQPPILPTIRRRRT